MQAHLLHARKASHTILLLLLLSTGWAFSNAAVFVEPSTGDIPASADNDIGTTGLIKSNVWNIFRWVRKLFMRENSPDVDSSSAAMAEPGNEAASGATSPKVATAKVEDGVAAWHYARMLQMGTFVNHPAELVETSEGLIVGKLAQSMGHRSFIGIPYAMPPVGSYRWQRPRPLNGRRPFETEHDKKNDSKTVYDARSPGRHCIQMAFPMSMPAFVSNQLSFFPKELEHEDCLNLNVYTPAPSASKGPSMAKMPSSPFPVMLFIYGGAFINGGINMPLFDPTNLVKSEPVIVVTPNYRTGVFGFLGSHQLQADAEEKDTESNFAQGTFGNYGVLDIIMALQWTKKNIAAFGGDPDRITLVGHSAGASIVSHLVVAAGTHAVLENLFHKAVIMSAALETFPDRYLTDDADDISQKLFDILSRVNECYKEPSGANKDVLIGVVDCLRDVPAESLFPEVLHSEWVQKFQILIDQRLFPKSPLELIKEGTFLKIPILATVCENDGSIIFPANGVHSRKEFDDTLRSLTNPSDETMRRYEESFSIPKVDDLSRFDWSEYLLQLFTRTLFHCPAYSFLDAVSKYNKEVYTHTFRHTLKQVDLAQMLGLISQLDAFHGSDVILLFASVTFLAYGNGSAVNEVRRSIMSFIQAKAEGQDAQQSTLPGKSPTSPAAKSPIAPPKEGMDKGKLTSLSDHALPPFKRFHHSFYDEKCKILLSLRH